MNKYELILSSLLLLIIDSIYLNFVKNYYNFIVNKIQGSDIKIRIISVILCYIFLIFGLNYFIIRKKDTIFNSFILGLIIYGVFETTNYAIFKNWTLKAVLTDTIWGGILYSLTTYLTYKLNYLTI